MDTKKIKDLQEEIATIKQAAYRLKEKSGGIQAIDRNTARILASLKMLEINVTDLLEDTLPPLY